MAAASLMPTLFVSHGSPMMLVEPSAAREFLRGFLADVPRPRAVLAVSAHWETDVPAVTASPSPGTIHDFYGFPPDLYQVRHSASGDPVLAEAVARHLRTAGLPVDVDPGRGLDHGAWVPLHLADPEAALPVVQLSVQPARDAAWHVAVGRALAPLRADGVLVLGSGSATHNLREMARHDPAAPAPEWVQAFADWLTQAVEEGRGDALMAWAERAPFAARNHPTPEHLLPLFVAFGAAGCEAGTRVHASTAYGVLAMDAYRWG